MARYDEMMYYYDIVFELSSLKLRADVAMLVSVGEEWRHKNRNDPFGRLYLIEGGAARIRHHGIWRDLKPGGYHLIPAHTTVDLFCPERAEIRYIHFYATILGSIDLFQLIPCRYDLEPEVFHVVRQRMMELEKCYDSNRTAGRLYFDGLLRLLLSPFILPSEDAANSLRASHFQPVLEYIEQNVSSRLRIPELAKRMHWTPEHFSREFSRCFGVPPGKYILRRRLELVQQGLKRSVVGLDSLAESYGFCDAFHLSKAFKKYFGASPTEFRRKQISVP